MVNCSITCMQHTVNSIQVWVGVGSGCVKRSHMMHCELFQMIGQMLPRLGRFQC